MKDTNRQVQKRASVHEGTVQAIARGEVGQIPTLRRKRAQNRSEPVHTHITVHPAVMAAAKELTTETSSYTRIEIVDADTVIVR